MKLATFNIYWLGGYAEHDVQRSGEDNQRLAEIIAEVNADVYVFQEIVDADVLREILDMADEKTASTTGRRYTMHDAQNHLLGVGAGAPQNDQQVVIAYDAGRYDLLASSVIKGGVSRPPFAARLRGKNGGGQLLVVGVHFKSGQPQVTDESSSKKRERQCQHLSDWLDGKVAGVNPSLPAPLPGEHVAVLGDFNAVYDSTDANHPFFEGDPLFPKFVASLNPLREGHMAEWLWEKPVPEDANDGQVSNYEENLLIDFIMFSPSLKGHVPPAPTIYAFDRLGPSGRRISDHRPVYAEVNI